MRLVRNVRLKRVLDNLGIGVHFYCFKLSGVIIVFFLQYMEIALNISATERMRQCMFFWDVLTENEPIITFPLPFFLFCADGADEMQQAQNRMTE